MPPALVAVALVAVGVPAAVHALSGRPLGPSAWLGSLAAALVAQAAGELAGNRAGVLGDAQLALAALGAALASVAAMAVESRRRPRRDR